MRDDELSFRDLVRRIAPYKWQVISATMVSTAAFLTAAFLMTPVYRVATVLAPAGIERTASSVGSTLGQLSGLANLVGVNVGSANSNADEALAVLRSQEFTQKFIADNDLMPQLYFRKWNAESKSWRVAPSKVPTLARAAKHFNEAICSVNQDRKTNLVTINIDWRDAAVAVRWSRALVAQLNRELRDRASANAERSIAFLEKEVAGTSSIETRDAISRLMESQLRQRMLAAVTEEYAFRVVDRGLAPDPDDFIRPKRVLWGAAGFALGLFCSLAVVLVGGALGARPRQ